ncbi:MAG: alkaline phosphatase [Myxococcales bacterium]|nr:alkaline phosphatase [Myxococcales bacterium]
MGVKFTRGSAAVASCVVLMLACAAACGDDPAADRDTDGGADAVDAVDGFAEVDADAADAADTRDGSGADDAATDSELDAGDAPFEVEPPPDAPGDGDWLELADGVGCERAVSATVAAREVALWGHEGEAAPSADVAVTLDAEPCGEVAVLTSAPWLDARYMGGSLHLSIADPHAIGLLHADAALVHADGAALLGTVSVTARIFPAAAADQTPHLLFIGIDGMRSDGLLASDAPTLHGLLSIGAWTLDGQTHSGTTDSSAGWTTLFTGVEPDRHLVANNDSTGLRDWSYRTFAWRLSNDVGVRTAMVAHWLPAAAVLHEGDAFERVEFGDDATVGEIAADWVASGEYDAILTHFDDVDHAGHSSGFSPELATYRSAIEGVDTYVAPIVDAVLARSTLRDEAWLVVVATDHGGEGTSHGARIYPCQRIPLIFAGTGVGRGELGGDTVTQMDVHPTILSFFGAAPAAPGTIDGHARLGEAEVFDATVRPPEVEAVCTDRVDEDGDRAIDCHDSDCDEAPACLPVCADSSLESAVGEGVATGSNAGEDTDYAITCARLPGARDVAFEWVAPSAGTWAADTAGSSYDTVLAAYAGSCPRPTAQLACNDDSDGYQSRVEFSAAAAGDVFTLVVTGFDGAEGDYTLSIRAVE